MPDMNPMEDFRQSLDRLKITALFYASTCIPDAESHREYLVQTEQLAEALLNGVMTGRLSPQQGAEQARRTQITVLDMIK